MTSERLRIRSADELMQQNRGLVELSNLLEGAGVHHYLAAGTLLGAVREKNFIPWDWDVQFYFRLEDVEQRFNGLLGLMQVAGFVPVKTDNSAKKWKIVVTKYNTLYEMTAWAAAGDLRVRSEWKMLGRFFNNPDRIEFLGHSYYCMTPAEDYLVHSYGNDWRVPKRTDDKDVYLAPTHYRKSALRRSLEKRIRATCSKIKRALLAAVQFRRYRRKDGEHET